MNRAIPATLAALLAGGGVAAQTSINGHLSIEVGSPVTATAINHGSALVLSLVVALSINSLPRAWRALKANRAQLRWWWFLGGLMGFVAVLAIISVTPEVGVVTVAVAITFGQLAGSVIADSAALGPGGRRRLNLLRALGLVVAVVAVVVGSIGRFEPGNLIVIPVVVAAGIVVALQQAANGWLVVVTGGEWAAMSLVNFVTSALGVGTALLIANAIQPIDFGAMPWWGPFGGILAAVIGVVIAITVRTIGILSSMLCIAAGQAIAAILLDVFVPVDAIGITAGSIIGAVLAVAAVGLAGFGALRGSRA